MAQPLPIAILGGSSAFTPALVHGLLERASDLPSLELRLQGRDPARLEGVTDFCRRHVQTLRDDWRVTSTLDLTDAVREPDSRGWLARAGA